MVSIADVLKELKDVTQLINMRRDSELSSALITSLASKIAGVTTWCTGTTTTLMDAITTSGLSSDLTTRLNAACDARIRGHLALPHNTRAASGAPPRDQTVRYLNNFLTSSDWATLDDPTSNQALCNRIVADRLCALGIRRAAEDGCVKWAIVVLLDRDYKVLGRWPSYLAVYHRVARRQSPDIQSRSP